MTMAWCNVKLIFLEQLQFAKLIIKIHSLLKRIMRAWSEHSKGHVTVLTCWGYMNANHLPFFSTSGKRNAFKVAALSWNLRKNFFYFKSVGDNFIKKSFWLTLWITEDFHVNICCLKISFHFSKFGLSKRVFGFPVVWP